MATMAGPVPWLPVPKRNLLGDLSSYSVLSTGCQTQSFCLLRAHSVQELYQGLSHGAKFALTATS